MKYLALAAVHYQTDIEDC